MPVEVVDNEAAGLGSLLVHELGDAGTRCEAVVVKDHDAADRKAIPDVSEHITR